MSPTPRTLLLSLIAAAVIQNAPSPRAAVDELLAADRAFSAAGSTRTAVDAMSAMFADDVVMPLPSGEFSRTKTDAVAALRASPDNVNSRVEWSPIRGGIAADGRHGFTVGYMTLHRSDNTRMPFKYVAYWVSQREGWRVAVYKRVRAGDGSAPRDLMPPALPPKLIAPSADAAAIAAFKESLDRAERAFSDEAQKIGLGAAFAKHGSADAVNVGPPTRPAFVVGAEAIGRAIGAGSPSDASPLSWAPENVIVASSGDLGVTYGMIRRNAPPAPGQAAAFAFITIWRRASPNDPWRYVAE